jgi:hypothetical protein
MEAVTGHIALVIEYLSQDDLFTPTMIRVLRFLQNGVAVCLVDSETRVVILFQLGTHLVTFQEGEEAKFAAILPEFRCSIGDLFTSVP